MDTRVALAACVVLGSALCGRAAADAVRRRAKTLASLAEGIRALRLQMTGMLEPVQCALSHSSSPLLSMVAEGMTEGTSAGDAWRKVRSAARRRGGPADALNQADVLALDAMFDRLGQSGRESQEALLNAALQTVERQLEGARAHALEADRLYVTIGLLVGVLLALIVL